MLHSVGRASTERLQIADDQSVDRASLRPKAGIRQPGLIVADLSTQRRRFSRDVGRPCRRPASGGSSGASGRVHNSPRAGVPRIAWQLTHDCAETGLARRGRPRRRRPACARSPATARNRPAESTTTRSSMLACCVPQYSAHWPTKSPAGPSETTCGWCARDQVGLAGQPRHPEAVAHVGRLERQVYRSRPVLVRWPECAVRWP